jgi:hypothetical protein
LRGPDDSRKTGHDPVTDKGVFRCGDNRINSDLEKGCIPFVFSFLVFLLSDKSIVLLIDSLLFFLAVSGCLNLFISFVFNRFNLGFNPVVIDRKQVIGNLLS